MKPKTPQDSPPKRNWVAKHIHQFCKQSVQRDRKNDYARKEKHHKREPYPEFIFA